MGITKQGFSYQELCSNSSVWYSITRLFTISSTDGFSLRYGSLTICNPINQSINQSINTRRPVAPYKRHTAYVDHSNMDRDLSEYNRSKFNNSKLMHHRRHTSLRRLIRATLNHQRGTLDAPVQLISNDCASADCHRQQTRVRSLNTPTYTNIQNYRRH